MTLAPRTATERLTLRPYRPDDWERFAAFYESDAARYVGGPLPRERTWNGFLADVGAWEHDGSIFADGFEPGWPLFWSHAQGWPGF